MPPWLPRRKLLIRALVQHKSKQAMRPIVALIAVISGAHAFLPSPPVSRKSARWAADEDSLSNLLTSRLPTSVEDQVRQASESLKRATEAGIHRHSIRLLLPVIGATELDDWPGGARQMMQAAEPLVEQMLRTMNGGSTEFNKMVLDSSDGVYALLAQAEQAADDSCSVLLPSADTVDMLKDVEQQVGEKRNMLIINPQWKRKADFGGWFGNGDAKAAYAETHFNPTFSLTNLICEGESVRVLRTYPGPWRVFIREDSNGEVDWMEVGQKDFIEVKPANWDVDNRQDGGRLFDYGQPSYQQIFDMIQAYPGYTPKNPAERAAAAFNFIKDTL